MPIPSHPPWLDHSGYTDYEAPHYVVSFSLPSFHYSSVQII
jgi:hypothetical protein